MLYKDDSYAQGFRLLDQTAVENGGGAVSLAPDSDEVADILIYLVTASGSPRARNDFFWPK